jgi:hypothetical protein
VHELPDEARDILVALDAPQRLLAHHAMVHDVAWTILDGIAERWPDFPVDRHAVLIGAATHDVGKAVYGDEMRGPGRRHENEGEAILMAQGIPQNLARFARTHGQWALEQGPTVEDLLVALANTVWIGRRNEHLENLLVTRIIEFSGEPAWSAFAKFDDILLEVVEGSGERLALYNRIPDEDE